MTIALRYPIRSSPAQTVQPRFHMKLKCFSIRCKYQCKMICVAYSMENNSNFSQNGIVSTASSSSTCFVKKALHSKDLNHKRFSKNGGQFLLFLTEFLLLSIRCGPRRDYLSKAML